MVNRYCKLCLLVEYSICQNGPTLQYSPHDVNKEGLANKMSSMLSTTSSKLYRCSNTCFSVLFVKSNLLRHCISLQNRFRGVYKLKT